jgi:hypothetical protein
MEITDILTAVGKIPIYSHCHTRVHSRHILMSSQDYTQSATKFPPKSVHSQRMSTLQYSIPTLFGCVSKACFGKKTRNNHLFVCILNISAGGLTILLLLLRPGLDKPVVLRTRIQVNNDQRNPYFQKFGVGID